METTFEMGIGAERVWSADDAERTQMKGTIRRKIEREWWRLDLLDEALPLEGRAFRLSDGWLGRRRDRR